MLKLDKSVVTDATYNQCGVIILDYSKRIMNEVFSIVEDNNLHVYYQDTDSI